MQRSSIIATVIAAGGILIAGSVASVAVINAASSSEVQSSNLDLVADEVPASASAPALPVPELAPNLASSLPSVEAAELPEVPTVDEPAPVAEAPVQQTVVTVAPSTPKPTKSAKREDGANAQTKKQSQPSARPTASPSSESTPEIREISGDKAVGLVLDSTGGGVAQSVDKTSRGGYEAWAVVLLRHDGSIVTGYVDRVSGVVFDWVVNQEAPAPTTGSSGSGSSGSGSSGGSDDDHEDESDDDDHGHEDESDDD